MITALLSWKTLAIIGAGIAAAWIIWDFGRAPCPYCDGGGYIPNYGPCDACEGYGR